MQLPASLAGKQVECPSCGLTIIAPDLSLDPAEPDSVKSKTLKTAKVVSSQIFDVAKAAANASNTPSRTSNTRYPNLSAYIRFLEMLTTISFWIMVAILLIVGVSYPILSILGIFGPINLLVVLTQVCVGVPIAYLLLVIWRMVCNATTEAMRVFIDIEQNTRAISQLTSKID